MVTEVKNAQKSQQSVSADFQYQTQTTSVSSNPSINITGNTGSLLPTKATEISFPTRSTLIPGNNILFQVFTKALRSHSDIQNDPNTSEKFESHDSSFGATSHHFQLQNTATLPISHFNRTQKNIPLSMAFTDYVNQFQNNSNVTNQSN